ncbi:MAG: acetate--CoA ligase family protein [Bacteroidia bacterium]|nr:acetate--CoA ligase family protein [Bacteroidia bacterium]
MITPQLIDPKSIAVIGASDNIEKPGGKALYNIKNGTFAGNLYAVNPKNDDVQGIQTFKTASELPQTDLAILAIPATMCVPTIKILLEEKNTKAIIVLSAGFSEMGAEGKKLEQEMARLTDEHQATLIGPNCIGVMNPLHQSVFTTPVPKMEWEGATLISSSGATCVFILESALSKGLAFSSVFSVGNAVQTCVEDVLEYLNKTYREGKSSQTILMYIESIKKPQVLLKNAQELIAKGCRLAAVKSGTSDAGGRAAASHTGAMLNSDMAVDALFRKAGIIRCNSRGELAAIGAVLQHPKLNGKRMGIITHAGGPAVILTDVLANGGMEVPHLPDETMNSLLSELFEGSSTANPIDILATGTAEQLQKCIQFCDKLEEIDGVVVVFGSPGLFSNADAYRVIREEQKRCQKPIYAVLPSILNAKNEMEQFVNAGGVFFEDEAVLGNALLSESRYVAPIVEREARKLKNETEIKALLKDKKGLIPTQIGFELLDLIGVERPKNRIISTEEEALNVARELGFPLVMKVVGPAHKSDVGGVVLNVKTMDAVQENFTRLYAIENAAGVELCQMESGLEVLIGVKKEPDFGHIITCGLGGIFVEILKDIQYTLAPVTRLEALRMIRSLKSYKMIQGARGKEGINEEVFADTICKISDLLTLVPEIEEMDLNPLMGRGNHLSAVDVVIRI